MAVVVTLVLAASAIAAPARAAPVQEGTATAAEVQDLIERAVDDDVALRTLREVARIDDVAVDLEPVLADLGPAGPLRSARLEALRRQLPGTTAATAATGAPKGNPAEARDRARRILQDDKYDETQLPKPFKGVLEWLADRLRPVGAALVAVFGPVVRAVERLPGGRLILVALAGATVGAGGWWVARRRTGTAVARAAAGPWGLVDPDLDPAELDRRAEQAERDGDLDAALRLRFEAGLLRLVRAGRLRLRPDTTASAAAAEVGEPALADLARRFEEVVYGGRAARPEDLLASRAGWAALLGAGSRS